VGVSRESLRKGAQKIVEKFSVLRLQNFEKMPKIVMPPWSLVLRNVLIMTVMMLVGRRLEV